MTGVTETVAEQIGRCLVASGLRQVFGVVGSGNFVVTDAMVRAGAEYVAARHEAAALGMADGYGRASGEVAVCSVHQGPGFMNTLTALTEAAKSRVPLVVVAGTTTAGMTRSNFYVDQVALARETGAATETVHHAANAVSDTVRAVERAQHEQRPVVLNVPLDVQASVVPVCPLPEPRQTVRATLPPPAVVAAVAERLRTARRPVLLAGRGAWRSGARIVLQQLAEEAGAGLATTAVAKGMFGGHPRDLGVGAEVHHFADHGSGMSLVRFPGKDIAAVARGFGARSETVRRPHELDVVGSWLAERDGPLVLDVKIDPEIVGHWAAQDFVGH